MSDKVLKLIRLLKEEIPNLNTKDLWVDEYFYQLLTRFEEVYLDQQVDCICRDCKAYEGFHFKDYQHYCNEYETVKDVLGNKTSCERFVPMELR